MAVKFEITEKNKEAIKNLEKAYSEVFLIKDALVFLNEKSNKQFDDIVNLLKTNYELEDLIALESNMYKFHYFDNVLEYLRDDIVEKFNTLRNKARAVFKEFWIKEQEETESRYKMLDKIQDDNKFRTVWSISEIDDFDNQFGYVKKVTYEQESIEVNKIVTWLEMWSIADKLVRLADHHDHIFIEAFAPSNKDGQVYELITGS